MEAKIATGIDTDIFYSALAFLKENGWTLTAEYDDRLFDKRVDLDIYLLTQKGEVLLMVWDNWFEGEIKAAPKILDELAAHFNIPLVYGAPEHLNEPEFIERMRHLLKFRK